MYQTKGHQIWQLMGKELIEKQCWKRGAKYQNIVDEEHRQNYLNQEKAGNISKLLKNGGELFGEPLVLQDASSILKQAGRHSFLRQQSIGKGILSLICCIELLDFDLVNGRAIEHYNGFMNGIAVRTKGNRSAGT